MPLQNVKGMSVHTLPGAYHSGRATKAQFEITLNKLLKGAGAGADPTEVDVPAGVKVKAETRDMTAASGNVSYTGYGFTPAGLIIFARISDAAGSIGSSDPARAVISITRTYLNDIVFDPTRFIFLFPSAGAYQMVATVASYDADGFTLTWTKVGSPTGTANMTVFAFA